MTNHMEKYLSDFTFVECFGLEWMNWRKYAACLVTLIFVLQEKWACETHTAESRSFITFADTTYALYRTTSDMSSFQVFSEKLDFATKEVSMSEFQKTGRGLSSLCIMINKRKTIRRI